MNVTFDFSGKVLLLTGAAGGIGRQIATIFFAAGADLVLADRDLAGVQAVADSLVGTGRIVCAELDAASPESIQSLVDLAVEEFGTIDIVVPGAGIYPLQLLVDMPDEEWRQVLSINLDGVFMLLKRVIPMMTTGGCIVTIASVSGHRGSYTHGHYAASKAGIIALTRSLALEIGPDIRINAVSPGTIKTPMTSDLIAIRGEQLLEQTPLHRNGEPAEVASVIAFLASDAASFVHGEVVHVNGGLFMAG